MPKVTAVADTTPVQIQVTVANYEPITTTVQAVVTARPITVTAETKDDFVYDGTEKSVSYNITEGTLADGQEEAVTLSGDRRTEVGGNK